MRHRVATGGSIANTLFSAAQRGTGGGPIVTVEQRYDGSVASTGRH